jgi:GLPGLI family protein
MKNTDVQIGWYCTDLKTNQGTRIRGIMRMKQLFTGCLFLLLAGLAHGQDFITRGKIEYEIKRNNRKTYADVDSRSSSYYAALPEYDVSYRDLTFSWNHWVYQQGRIAPTVSHNVGESSTYINLDTRETVSKKRFIDDYFVFGDSLRPIKWKIENETRKIAGWECRKAVGRIYDSVYVVAFYCPEIITQGGPEFFTGLPGMILGLAIPRYYTTWFATKIEVASIDESKILPPTMKKGKQYAKKDLAEVVLKKYKESGWWKDVTLEKVMETMTDFILR